jgi:hypothetical protein
MQCSRCYADNRAGRKLCVACGQALVAAPATSAAAPAPQSYTPTHLAEKILATRATADFQATMGQEHRPNIAQ